MYKYRRLTIDELEILKDDFVKFLASNGIDGLEWVRLKNENLEEANNHIDLFSDIVIDNALNNIQWLEFFDGKSMKCFQCETDKIFLNSVQSPHLYTSWAEMVQNIKNAPSHFSTIKIQKNYTPERNLEIFRMLETGASISTKETFEWINQLI